MVRLYIDHNFIKTSHYEVESTKIPSSFDGYKILQLSDLHQKDFKNQLYDKIVEESPNIIVMTGDMVSTNQTNFTTFYQVAKTLAKKYPVYYIKGNHEGRMEDKSGIDFIKQLQSFGVIVLDNEKILLEKDNKYINLYGMWCNQRFYSKLNTSENNVITENIMTKLLGKTDHRFFNILLMHTPQYFEAYEKWGADLVLAGHLHGGMIRIPLIGGIFSPYLEWFPKYCYGEYHQNNATMIISGGLSAGATGFRFFNRPEIVVVTLHTK